MFNVLWKPKYKAFHFQQQPDPFELLLCLEEEDCKAPVCFKVVRSPSQRVIYSYNIHRNTVCSITTYQLWGWTVSGVV